MPLSADTFTINLYVALASPVIGSGIAAGAARFANGASWDFTPSTCPACGRRLGLLELIPLVSWAAQRGKCRGCSAPISRSYPMIELAALHDRNPQYVTLSDGSVRNGYELHLVNRQAEERRFLVGVEGLKGAKIESAGLTSDPAGRLMVSVGRDQTLELRVLITVPATFSRESKSQNVVIRAVEPVSGAVATVNDHFFLP
jgi:hypothetical protein